MQYCPRCRLGRFKKTRVPFVQPIDDVTMLVPNMQAWVCDFCGETEYDANMMLNVQYLVHQHEVRDRKPARMGTKPPPAKHIIGNHGL